MTIRNVYVDDDHNRLVVERSYESETITVEIDRGRQALSMTLPLDEWRQLLAPIM